MENAKRAMCFNEAKDNGLVFGDYKFKNLPEEFTGVLMYKVWGKSMNLLLFVEDERDGSQYCLSIFRRNDNKFYAPRKMQNVDFSDKEFQPSMRFIIKTKTTKNGNTDLLEIVRVGSANPGIN